ncbi:hypothetical protein [Halovulum sp. GXIMD14793]
MNDFASEIDAVNWSEFRTAYGAADNVPFLLEHLAGADPKKSADATHELWCGLCHQHAYVSSAALPSYPILVKILRSANPELGTEILDILWGFAKCTAPRFGSNPAQRSDWMVELHNKMVADIEVYVALAASKNEDSSEFAGLIAEELNKS